MRTLPLLCAVVLAVGGCSRNAASPAKVAAQAPAATAPATVSDDDRALALAPPNGSGPTDAQIARLEASAQRDPDKMDLWVLLGRGWVRKARESADPGYYAHADACARIALVRDPSSAIALDLRAMVLLNDHKFEQARGLAASIVERRRDDPTAYGTLSDALLELGRFDEAAAAVQAMVDLKPNLPSYSRAAYVRWLHGDVNESKSILRHAIDAGGGSRDPEPLAWVLVQAAQLFWNEGDYAGADAGFDRALALLPDFPPALVGKGRVAFANGDAKRAISLLEAAYERSPLAQTAWLLGDARAAAGDASGSAAAYEQVLIEGRRADGRTLALFLATKNRNPEESRELARRELGTRGDLYTRDAYAWALYRSGRLAEARDASDRALALGTRDASLWYHAGAIRLAMGDAGGAGLVQRALSLNPHFDETGAGEAQALLRR